MDAVLYLLVDKSHSKVKIGITSFLESRLVRLSADFGELDLNESYLVTDTALNITKLERTLHFMFESWRVETNSDAGGHSEWFRYECLDLVTKAIADIGQLQRSERVMSKGIDPSEVFVQERSHSSALAYLLFKETRFRILLMLLLEPDEVFHVNEIIRATGCGVGSTTREIKSLYDTGIISRDSSGNMVRYSANKDCIIFEELVGILSKMSDTDT